MINKEHELVHLAKQRDYDDLLSLADNMASSATTFNGQGYDGFIYARDLFKETLHHYVLTSKLI